MTTCNRCGKAVGTNDWDIHTCTPKPGLCDDCETVSHCLKHGCIPKVGVQSEVELLRAQCKEWERVCDQHLRHIKKLKKRTWVGLTFEEQADCLEASDCRDALCASIEAKLKEKNT